MIRNWRARLVALYVFQLSLFVPLAECEGTKEGTYNLDTAPYQILVAMQPKIGYFSGGRLTVDNNTFDSGFSEIDQNAEFWNSARYITSSHAWIQIRKLADHSIIKEIPTMAVTAISNVQGDSFYYLKGGEVHYFDLLANRDTIVSEPSEAFHINKIWSSKGGLVLRLVWDTKTRTISFITEDLSIKVVDLIDGKVLFSAPAFQVCRNIGEDKVVYYIERTHHRIVELDLETMATSTFYESKKPIFDFVMAGKGVFLYVDDGKTATNASIWNYYYFDGKTMQGITTQKNREKIQHTVTLLSLRQTSD